MSNKWNTLRHSRTERGCMKTLAAHPPIAGDDTPDIHATFVAWQEADALNRRIDAIEAEHRATYWAQVNANCIAATCVYRTAKAAVYQMLYRQPVPVTYANHNRAPARSTGQAAATQ